MTRKSCVGAGDRYLLKLFRDFLLHQVKEDGTPTLEWGHIVESLNKLDAGVLEKVRVALQYTSAGVGHTVGMSRLSCLHTSVVASLTILSLRVGCLICTLW